MRAWRDGPPVASEAQKARLEVNTNVLKSLVDAGRGGEPEALFCDRRYHRVFVHHNGVQSYDAARGFRGALAV